MAGLQTPPCSVGGGRRADSSAVSRLLCPVCTRKRVNWQVRSSEVGHLSCFCCLHLMPQGGWALVTAGTTHSLVPPMLNEINDAFVPREYLRGSRLQVLLSWWFRSVGTGDISAPTKTWLELSLVPSQEPPKRILLGF